MKLLQIIPPPELETKYKLELTFDELVRIFMLSMDHEGGDKFPLNGAYRLHEQIHFIEPAIDVEARKRKSTKDYVHPGGR